MKSILTLIIAINFLVVINSNILFANSGEAWQYQTGSLSGKIVDGKSGETLTGATVVIDGNTNLAAATDLDGNYVIANVSVGRHKVSVRYIGYQ